MKSLIPAVLLSAAALTAAFTVAVPQAAQAATWPDKTVTMVVPFPPGGSTDSLARVLAPSLQKQLGQNFIVDNKPGATGTIGAGQVARAAPDGSTLLVSSLAPFVVSPHLIKSLPYDALRDFDLVTVAVQAPNLLVVPAASPLRSVADVIAQSKKEPGRMTFASSGNGSSDHLTAELFWLQTKTEGTHVPYKGGAPAIQDLLGGQIDASFQNINAVISHVQAGKLRALAVTGTQRSKVLPDVPTLAESGVQGVDVYSWQAVAAPKGLPPEAKQKLHAALVAALREADIAKRFADVGFEIVANTPEQFADFQRKEFARWKQVIETRKITAD